MNLEQLKDYKKLFKYTSDGKEDKMTHKTIEEHNKKQSLQNDINAALPSDRNNSI